VLVLATKLLLAPACVVAATLAARRWGTRVGGLVGGLPVVGGPILLVLAMIHGREFGADAAAGSLGGLIALTAFVLAYGHAAPRSHPVASVVAGWTAFLATVLALSFVELPRGLALVVLCVLFAAASRALPPADARAPGAAPPSRWDLPVRALAALTLVLVLSAVSGSLGGHVSGLLAPFPIITAVLAVFTHHLAGHNEVQTLLRGFLAGFYGYAAFCFTVAVALPDLSIAAAFALAVLAALATQFVVVSALARARTAALTGPPRPGDTSA
jgi:hypothetical protein